MPAKDAFNTDEDMVQASKDQPKGQERVGLYVPARFDFRGGVDDTAAWFPGMRIDFTQLLL